MPNFEPQPMSLQIFDLATRTVIGGGRGQQHASSLYGHTFGSGGYQGLQPRGDQPAVHLLLRLDTADPLVPVELTSARWLPLLCAIRYGACDMVYKVLSDTRVEVIALEAEEPWENYPFAGYPEILAEEPIGLADWGYDPNDPVSAWANAGIFGLDHLSAQQMKAVEEFVVENGLYNPELDEETVADYLEFVGFPYVQGPPPDDCRNPGCSAYQRSGVLVPLAIFQEGDDRRDTLWSDCGENLQITFQICGRCQAIHVSNQCT